MRIYTVHLGPQRAGRERDVRFVKEGFSWPAFFVSLPWALVKGLWRVALGFFLAQLALSAAIEALHVSDSAAAGLTLAYFILAGMFGNDLMRAELARRGYAQIGVIAASDLAAAEQRAFERIPALSAA